MESLKNTLIRHEGLRLKPYRDSVGKMTIGIGRNLDDQGISEEEAGYLLENDIAASEEGLLEQFPWFQTIDIHRRHVLINMNFNLGMTRLKTFKKMLAALARRDFHTAAAEMLDSKWATQVGKRAEELAAIMRGEDWNA